MPLQAPASASLAVIRPPIQANLPRERDKGAAEKPPSRLKRLVPHPAIPSNAGRFENSLRNLANGLSGLQPAGILPAFRECFKNPIVVGVGGTFAVAGGLLQGYNGIRDMIRGDRWHGLAHLGTGAFNIAGGIALAIASPTVSIAFGAASIVDGTRDVIHGVHHSQRDRIVSGGLKNAGGSLLVAGGALAVASVGLVPGAFMAAAGGLLCLGVTIADNRAALGRLLLPDRAPLPSIPVDAATAQAASDTNQA